MIKVDKLIVCGDSFNAYSRNSKYAGSHWSQILSKKLNLPLLSFASEGCSSKLVAFQMLEALNHPGSLVISSPAAHHFRLELLVNKSKARYSEISLKSFIQTSDCNVNKDPHLRSINANFLEKESIIRPAEANAILNFVPLELNKYTDKWSLFYALYRLKKDNFNFMFYDIDIFGNDRLFDNKKELEELISARNLLDTTNGQYRKYLIDRIKDKKVDDPGYHTKPESQEIIAEDFFKEINDRELLT